MPFDGIVTTNIVRDLNDLLQGGKIDKIYQPSPDEIILSVHRGKEKHKVFLTSNSSDARIQLISQTPPNPTSPPAFCMLLRKHIQGGTISNIIQKDTERIAEFCIDAFNELGYPTTKKIIVEIMGKHSNITLVDAGQDKIIDSIKRISFDINRYRQLLPGMKYIYPPTQNKIPVWDVTYDALTNYINNFISSISKALVGIIMGFSPFFANTLCINAGVDSEKKCSSVSDNEIKQIYNELCKIVKKIEEGDFYPVVWIDEDKTPIDFHCFDNSDYSSAYTTLKFESIDLAQEYYYSKKKSTNLIKQKSSDLEKVLKTSLEKLYLKKSKLSEDLLQAQHADIYKIKGELLFANIHLIKSGASYIELQNYYTNLPEKIQLDPKLSPSANAQKYYKKYNKLKTALTEKTIQLEETGKEISYLESIQLMLETSDNFSDIDSIRHELAEGGYIKKKLSSAKNKSVSAAPHQYFTVNGFKILSGRNNNQNDVLTLKTAGPKDIWFHTKDIPGTHVILFTDGKTPGENDLFDAASIAAYYSKGKLSSNVPVDYTLAKYVKKPSGAKPGMVIFTHNKTLYVEPKLPKLSENV